MCETPAGKEDHVKYQQGKKEPHQSGHWLWRRCPLKVFFSYFSSGNHFVQQSRTILAILVKGHKKDISVYFEIRPLAMEMSFKGFSILSSGDHFVQQSRTILAIW